jgi:valyl-tRNA synthetase
MMDKTYNPAAIESGWYQTWEDRGYFKPAGGSASYCIMLPPPNVTGSLHMGHAFQQTLMDTLIRYHRMNGDNTLWQCGTDHAGIATQMVVERQLEAEGKHRRDLGREKFTAAVWQWKETSGNTITRQSRRLGTSMDWSRERFTMDEGLSSTVRQVFIRLYNEGLIYRGKRLVNWDPVLHTAISDLEVIAAEEDGFFWHIRYPRSDGKGHITVATTRPETMLGDAAVAVHPEDARYRDLIGKQLILPLTGRTIPVIADDYVDPEFGTGCVKITPAHDFNDYAVGQRHNLEQINIFTIDACINEHAPEAYRGMDRYQARKQIIADLQQEDLLEKVVPHRHIVPRGDRSHAVIEPYLTDQWYVRIQPLADPAIKAVETGQIRFVPQNWAKTYFEWMRNIEDWCISRQLWWGHRIPAWYDSSGNIYVGEDETDVRKRYQLPDDFRLEQDPDVLDTWFSSALWPFSTLGWPQESAELHHFYPTSVLVTGFDIIFFWVARMIMMGIKFMGDVPFREVYITGLIRDEQGQKMSKSKGNILDPLDLIDGINLEDLVTKRTRGLMQPKDAPGIEKSTRRHFPDGIDAYGTDALRFTFAALATQGRDIRFDVGRIQGYRNFCNKIWNAARYVFITIESADYYSIDAGRKTGLINDWILTRLSHTISQVHDNLQSYRFDLASQAIYEFIWDEFCDWYLELSKSVLNSSATDEQLKCGTCWTLITVLEAICRMTHPVMPFITEEIWQRIAPLAAKTGATVMLQPYPQTEEFPVREESLATIEWVKAFIMGVRRIRAERDITPGKRLTVLVQGGTPQEHQWLQQNMECIQSLGRIDAITHTTVEPEDAVVALAGDMTLLVPLAELIDLDAELVRLKTELAKKATEIERLQAKLANKNFVGRAPATVVDKERKRLQETESSLANLQQQYARIAALL